MARVPDHKRDDIMIGLTDLIMSGQILGATHQQLADKFSVQRQSISKYLKKIYANIPPEDINHIRVKIQVMFDRVFREANSLMRNAKGSEEKTKAIELLLKCMDKFQGFLESFGIKEQVADKLDGSL